MNSDHDLRQTRPSIWGNYRGSGVNIRFLCPCCGKPSEQRGSKLKHFRGLRQRVCGPCHENLSK